QDPSARTLSRQGAPVAITPKAFDTLLYLVSNAGRTVGREEMIRALWPDTFVEEGNLNYNISQIRKTLGEYAPGVPYIQTLPKQGYRFIAEVSQPNASQVNGAAKEPTARGIGESAPPAGSVQPKRLGRMWAAVALILLAATALMTS